MARNDRGDVVRHTNLGSAIRHETAQARKAIIRSSCNAACRTIQLHDDRYGERDWLKSMLAHADVLPPKSIVRLDLVERL